MKSRLNIMVMTLLVILAVLIWVVVKNQKNTNKILGAIPLASVDATAKPIPEASVPPATLPAIAPPPLVGRHTTDEAAHIGDDDTARHIARPGETVTSLAADLLGKDTKVNRDAIISANASLKADPDKLVAGKSYRIPTTAEAPPVVVAPLVGAPAAPKPTPEVQIAAPPTPKPLPEVAVPAPKQEVVETVPPAVLKYIARRGDTVATMAQAFLGNDDKVNQDAIINANPSLQADPDHVAIGASYRIPAPNGLSASPPRADIRPRPTSQPDADSVVKANSPRTLRYTALPGDSVTTLAIKLLGSDTQDARDLIISNNPSLKKDPDRVIAGQTYWIPAPVAATPNP
jgi:hypothetical protein